VRAIGKGDRVPVGEIDLYYVGGGQDREQALVAHDLTSKAEPLREAVERDAAFLAVCGGYQLLGSFYRDTAGEELPGIGILPMHTVAGGRRMIGDVLLDCSWAGETLAGFENHAGRTVLGEGAEPLGRVLSGFGNDGASGYEGCRYRSVYGTYLHGPLLPRNPWFADRVLADALAHAGAPEALEPLPDELERQAHAVSAARARARGGRY
jgi:CobQ-like glutamine amidotransferase family enzyme